MLEDLGRFTNLIATILSFIGEFIFSILNTIQTLIYLFGSIIEVIIRMVNVLPDELNVITHAFVTLYGLVLVYKLVRKG